MKRTTIKDFPDIGDLIRDNEKYKIYDIGFENWRVSMTQLYAHQSTTGHSHEKALEIYFFIEGQGKIQINDNKSDVKKDDIILIDRGEFHRVFNETDKELIFICVFEEYEGREKITK